MIAAGLHQHVSPSKLQQDQVGQNRLQSNQSHTIFKIRGILTLVLTAGSLQKAFSKESL